MGLTWTPALYSEALSLQDAVPGTSPPTASTPFKQVNSPVKGKAVLGIQIDLIWIPIQDFGPVWIQTQGYLHMLSMFEKSLVDKICL